MLQNERVQNDSYVVQRLSGALKQVIVGLGSLATGVFGLTALGMLALALRVGAGVLQGELDPSPEARKSTPRSRMSFEEVMASVRGEQQGLEGENSDH